MSQAPAPPGPGPGPVPGKVPGKVPGDVRWISVGTFVAFGLLFALTYRYVPALQYQWGLDLLRYLPELVAWGVTLLALLVTTEEARRGLIRAGDWIASLTARWPEARRDALVFAGALALLLLGRERVMLGDSQLLASLLSQSRVWTYPEPGSLFVLRGVYHLALAFRIAPTFACQIFHCVAGAVAIVFVLRAARGAVPEGRGAGWVPLLVFSGGLFAAVAGRFDVQALPVCAAAAHLWLATRFLAGKGGLAAPALAFGVAAWLQPLFLFAAPGLLWLPRLAGRRLTPAVGLALVPLALHTAQLLVFAPKPVALTHALGHAWIGVEGWVRGWGGEPSIGTDYVFLSPPHLKYLANAGFVLAPATLPIAVAILALRRRAALAPPAVRFVAAGAAGLLLGTAALRPAWGPFDWDLFAVTGLWIAFLGAVLLAGVEARAVRTHVAAAAIGLQICFVGLPLVGIGQGAARDGGLFEERDFNPRLLRLGQPPPKHIAPWL